MISVPNMSHASWTAVDIAADVDVSVAAGMILYLGSYSESETESTEASAYRWPSP